MIKLLRAFEGRILCYDPYPSQVAKDLGTLHAGCWVLGASTGHPNRAH